MTDRELDARLAKALGVDINDKCSAWYHKRRLPSGDIVYLPKFSPSTSVDVLRKWVLPEVVKRHRWTEFLDHLCDKWEGDAIERDGDMEFAGWLIEQEPSVLAAAALEVLEASNAHM